MTSRILLRRSRRRPLPLRPHPRPVASPTPSMLARCCPVADHPEAAAIDAALLASTPIRAVADARGLSYSAIQRHRAHLLNPAAIQGAADVARARDAASRDSAQETPGWRAHRRAQRAWALLAVVFQALRPFPGALAVALEAVADAERGRQP